MKSATCKKKKRFPTKQTADRMVNKIWQKKNWDTSYGLRPTHSYLCPDCDGWHMTSQMTKRKVAA